MSEIKNLDDLRAFLTDGLKKVASGENTPATANAMSNIAGKILTSVKLELEHSKMLGVTPRVGFIKQHNSVNKLSIDKKDK